MNRTRHPSPTPSTVHTPWYRLQQSKPPSIFLVVTLGSRKCLVFIRPVVSYCYKEGKFDTENESKVTGSMFMVIVLHEFQIFCFKDRTKVPLCVGLIKLQVQFQ
ncbi:hypothetical protein HUJ05_002999 [Dendroctonus ponderosae]|nr:hypothetical protein HUJ05_002999 [Dendroctonus ponderosae]